MDLWSSPRCCSLRLLKLENSMRIPKFCAYELGTTQILYPVIQAMEHLPFVDDFPVDAGFVWASPTRKQIRPQGPPDCPPLPARSSSWTEDLLPLPRHGMRPGRLWPCLLRGGQVWGSPTLPWFILPSGNLT